MTKQLFKDTCRTIKNHFSRYVSILLIVALGTAFFVGIKATAPDMFATAEQYFQDYNLCDLRLQSSIGFTEEDVAAIRGIEGIEYAAGVRLLDALVRVNGEIESDIDGTQISTRAYGISPLDITNFLNGRNDGGYINRVRLIEGRFPMSANECLVDNSRLSTPESYKLGSVITLENAAGEQPEELSVSQFTIVGVISSPYYLSFERGNTDIGSGKIGTFIEIPTEAFASDYYSEVYITVAGSDAYAPFSDDFSDFIAPYAEQIRLLSPSLINTRVTALRPQLLQRIQTGEQKIADTEAQFNASMGELDGTIAQLQKLVDQGEALVQQAQKEFDEKYADAKNAITQNTAQYQQAIADYNAKLAVLQNSKAEYETKLAALNASRERYDTLNDQYERAYTQVQTLETTLSNSRKLLEAGETVLNQVGDATATNMSSDEIQSAVTMIQATYPELYAAIKGLTAQGLAVEILNNLTPYVESQRASIEKSEADIAAAKSTLETVKTQLDAKRTELETAATQLASANAAMQQAERELNNYYQTLTEQGINLKNGDLELEIERLTAQQELNTLKQQVADAPANLETAKTKRAEAQAQFETNVSFARTQLSDAKSLYAKLDTVQWNIFTRDDTPGYRSYGQSVQNIRVLSNIFPIFFFVISSLVCLTTVTRLVEEDRTLLGTYKALGYSDGAILSKYVIYSLSACLIGSVIGISGAIFLFPFAINKAYGIMYTLPPLIYRFPVGATVAGLLIALGSTAFVTVFAVMRDLKLNPAVLMRPKAPKTGKRILLERMPYLWKRLSFTAKVTARNLFRNKSRFSMTVTGIAGSAALLLASLGMYNSIYEIRDKQYETDPISKYDFQIVFDDPQPTAVHSEAFSAALRDPRIDSLCLVSMKSMAGGSGRSDASPDVYVFVPEQPAQLAAYVDLRDRHTHAPITLDDTGAVITEMLAEMTNTKVGDAITFTDASGRTFSTAVSAIAENYTFHYIYMTPVVYRTATGQEPEFDYALGTIGQGFKNTNETDLANLKGQLATDIMRIGGVTTVAYTSDTTEIIGPITDALSLVILLFFVSALVLTVVVLYNLSNINIIERTRELATLKVLGFSEKEVRRYIFRENAIVSVFGIAFGLLLGVALHRLLITFTAIDSVMYGQSISWWSYLIAVGVTVLFIAAVNLSLRGKTAKIDMVESLKSVE